MKKMETFKTLAVALAVLITACEPVTNGKIDCPATVTQKVTDSTGYILDAENELFFGKTKLPEWSKYCE